MSLDFTRDGNTLAASAQDGTLSFWDVSGGVDSSFMACLSKDLGLRPLVVHFDNGWNSELAVGNIEQLVTRLGLHLETFVMDWDEFRDARIACG